MDRQLDALDGKRCPWDTAEDAIRIVSWASLSDVLLTEVMLPYLDGPALAAAVTHVSARHSSAFHSRSTPSRPLEGPATVAVPCNRNYRHFLTGARPDALAPGRIDRSRRPSASRDGAVRTRYDMELEQRNGRNRRAGAA